MARPTLLHHRKFRRLEAALGSRAIALGSLELIWQSSYESGDEILGSSEDVEATAWWTGQAGQLTAALEKSGFIDQLEDGQYRVHDLWDHAPGYVRRRRHRELARRANGRKLAEEDRTVARHRQATDEPVTRQWSPLPTPYSQHPTPKEKQPLVNCVDRSVSKSTKKTAKDVQWSAWFESEFWPRYPRKVAKKAALKAWTRLQPKQPERAQQTAELILTLLEHRKVTEWADRPRDRIPHPGTWLNSESFEEADVMTQEAP